MNHQAAKSPLSLYNRVLSTIYIVLYVLLPAVVLIVSLGFQEETESIYKSAIRIIFFFVSMPVYVVYATMIFRIVGSLTPKWMILLLLPQLLNFGWYLYSHHQSGLLDILVLDSIPTFCGIYVCLFIGLAYLIFVKTKAAQQTEGLNGVLGRLFATLVIVLLIFSPVVFFLIRGWELSLAHTQITPILAISKYIFSIFLVMLAHYKVIIDLYHQGKM